MYLFAYQIMKKPTSKLEYLFEIEEENSPKNGIPCHQKNSQCRTGYLDWGSHLVNPPALDAQAILIDRDDMAILQDGLVIRLNGAKIHRHQQWGCKNGPHSHLGLALLITEAEVANN